MRKVIIIIVSLIVVILASAPLLLLHQMLDHHIDYIDSYSDEEFGIKAEEHFVTTADGLNIAIYEVKADNPKAVILTLSGIEKPSVKAYMGHAAMFRQNAYSTIMIEMRAHGRSEGERICLGYKETQDVNAALEYVKSNYDNIPIIIMGLSMGAGVAINSMAEFPELAGLISLSAFSSCEKAFGEILEQSIPKFAAAMLKPFLYSATFLRYGSAVRLKPISSITKLNGRPALLMHTEQDSNVSYANFLRLKAEAPANAQLYSFEGDEHFITPHFLDPENDTRYSSILLNFIDSVIKVEDN